MEGSPFSRKKNSAHQEKHRAISCHPSSFLTHYHLIPISGITMTQRAIISLLLFFNLLTNIMAQEMSVKSFEYLPMDLIARTHPREDLNGKPCAVIRVGIALQGVVFEGNLIGKPVYNTGEYLVYITNGSRQLTIRHNNYLPLTIRFADYGIEKVESSNTYRLTVLTNASPEPSSPSGNFVIMNVSPSFAKVSIDGESIVAESEGLFKRFMQNGTHTYQVDAGNAYMPVSGNFEMNGERITIPVTLQSLKASLSVKTTTGGTNIYINEDYKGTDQWQGSLPPGTYLLEAKKEGYRPYSSLVKLTQQQSETITVPALQATRGSLLVDYKPVDADIYLDNRLLGKSPNVFSNILTGKHSIKISKAGYNDHTETFTIQEGKQTSLTGSLSQGMVSSSSVLPIEVKGITFNMVRVEGGTFDMGATPEQVNPFDNEKPVHQVTLSSYYIGETEVTQALWQAVMGSNPSEFKGGNLPVEKVSWDDCQTFIERLNTITHRKFRLPTEAEWEFAARGGNKSRYTQYSGSDNLDEVAWYDRNSNDKTHPVKSKKANELGIYDMSGNVWEWCQDWFGKYDSSPQNNPTGPDGGSNRVCRGGSWLLNARICRLSYRFNISPGRRNDSLGLRLVLSE